MIDHLVYATPDLDATLDALADRLGVRPAAGGRHPGLGTRNALLGLGEATYLEVIGVDVDAVAHGPRPFGLDGTGSARLAAWAARVDGLEKRVTRSRAAGYDPGPPGAMSRRCPDGSELRWRLTAPSDEAVEVVPFLIEWGPGTQHPSATSPPGCRLAHFAGAHPQPGVVRAALAALGVDLAVEPAPAPALIAVIEGPGGILELR